MRSAITESHSQIYFLILGVFFLYLGILLRWPGADLRIWLSIALAAVALVVGREMAVQLGGWTRHVPGHLRAMLRTSTPRGLTSAVLVAVLIPWLGTGAWVTVAVSVILISNLWMMILSAKLARASAGERE
jgi:NhaP-type Na+/H+ or K+/H+ antiporter